MVILTGDTHGEFGRIEEFCAECGTSTDDVMVILGDAGINFYRDKRDDELKEYLSELPVTLLCIYGNHEERPDEILGYEEMEWNGGIVLFQPDYPNILFAWDGKVYDFDGKRRLLSAVPIRWTSITGWQKVCRGFRRSSRMPSSRNG